MLAGYFRRQPCEIAAMSYETVRSSMCTLIQSSAPQQSCQACAEKGERGDAKGAIGKSWMQGWRITCRVCGGGLTDDDDPQMAQASAERFSDYWDLALDGESLFEIYASAVDETGTSPLSIAILLCLPRWPGPGELSDGYRISRLLNIVVSGFDDFAHRMGLSRAMSRGLFLPVSLRIPLLAGVAIGARAERPPERILYFTYSAGYRHDAIPLSKAILTQLGRNSGAFEVTATEDTSEFSTENLERYAAVMFYTTGELPMSGGQKAALLNFVRSGRGFLGVHSATDTFYAWPDYLDLIGGYFNGHPWHQVVTIEVADAADPVVAFLGNSLQLKDEIYQISDFDYRGSRVLLRLDQSSVDLGRTGVHQRFYGWPLAWKRSFGEGRVFYTALGHQGSGWQDPRYQRLPTKAVLRSTRRSP